jgi:GT2 family glycosyltransferase
MMISLHDGAQPVQSVSVLCLVKNNEKWLKYALPRFKQMEGMYSVRFEYYFFENDSKDQTHSLIDQFLKDGRIGRLFTDSLPAYINTGVNYDRVNRLASLRNRLADAVAPLKTDWTIMLDTDIYFEPATLQKLFACKPAANNIGMVTPYAHEIVTGAILKAQKKVNVDVPDDKVYGVNHYYDTFAFVDELDHNFWPNCNFAACKQCKQVRKANPAMLIPADQELVDVRSAFGGFAIVESAILNDTNVRWKTLDLFGKFSVCEHVAFCDALRKKYNKRIVVDQRVNNVMWIKELS